VRAGAGFDTIDIAAASELAVFVANCPGKNSIAVAELAFALLLSCDRRIPDATADLRAGKWRKKEYSKASGVAGRRLAVIGVGNIGAEVIRRAHGFAMKVTAWSRSLTPEKAAALGVDFAATPAEAVRNADAVSLHFAATADTKGFANAAFFEAMKPGATFINTTRGSVVDEAALRAAIETKKLRAGLDVFANEPGAADADYSNDLLALPGVYATPHIGASTDQAQEAIADEAVRMIVEYAATGVVLNCVNLQTRSRAKAMLVVRHRNLPGVLASVLDSISHGGVNVEEMQNMIYDGGAAACARISLGEPLSDSLLAEVRQANAAIVSVSLTSV
jgi:D-3-phosphoglycerate dehydrogenase